MDFKSSMMVLGEWSPNEACAKGLVREMCSDPAVIGRAEGAVETSGCYTSQKSRELDSGVAEMFLI